MDSRLLRYYERELQHLREGAVEFAVEFPKQAGRLSLSDFACEDPYVERLLEGFAYLSARIQVKLDAEFPRVTQSLLETVYPNYLAPVPSMTIIQAEPEPSLREPYVLPREMSFKSLVNPRSEPTPCEYRIAHPVTMLPVEIVEARYVVRDLGTLGLRSIPAGVRAALKIKLRTTCGVSFDKLPGIDAVNFYLQGADGIQHRLFEQVIGHGVRVVLQQPDKVRSSAGGELLVRSAEEAVRPVGFEPEEALLPTCTRSFEGYRLLQEYFSFSPRFMFVEFFGLAAGLSRCTSTEIDLVLLLNEVDTELENRADAKNFALFCTPAINLFPKQADRIQLTDRFFEFPVVPDRNRTRDFEVFQVMRVTGMLAGQAREQEFQPFYASRDGSADQGAYYSTYRQKRVLSEKERRVGQRSSYAGSELYLTLVDSRAAPYHGDLKQLSIATLCTNRDLPSFVPRGRGHTDFTWESGAPLRSARAIAGPSLPRPSNAEGETAWRMISHLSLNYLSLLDNDSVRGAAALRDMLRLYVDLADPSSQKQVDGVKSIASRGITRRVPTPGPISFGRGLEVAISVDETSFEGSGVFLLGCVLERFLAKYVTINSFTETVLKSAQRGEIMRWPARIGRRAIL